MVAANFFDGAVEEQHRHLDLHQPRAGKRPAAGEGRRMGVKALALGRAHLAHSVQAHRAPDRRETQDQQQAGKNRVHAVGHVRIAVVVGDVADQHEPLHPARSPTQRESGAARQKQPWKTVHCQERGEVKTGSTAPMDRAAPCKKRARQPAGVAPEREEIGGRHAIVQQKRRADADAGNLQRRGRAVLKPHSRPERLKGADIVCHASAEITPPGIGRARAGSIDQTPDRTDVSINQSAEISFD